MSRTSTKRAAKPTAGNRTKVTFDIEKIRRDFPVLRQKVHGKPLVYLDNAATTQKPRHVIEAVRRFYAEYYSNVHRGVHDLSLKATIQYEHARTRVKNFINAKSEKEIIFTRGTTESINLIAHSFGRQHVGKGDEVVISALEHHSNIVPWQMLCQEKGAKLRVIPMNDKGELIFEEYERLLNKRTRLVAFVYISNALGTINPAKEMIQAAHAKGIPVLIDGAQAVAHMRVDVQDLDCDFFAFSGHKTFAPTGIGALYGKSDILEEMPPFQGGGDMITTVSFEKSEYKKPPYRFEAGTPNIAGAIGLGAAIDFFNRNDLAEFEAYENELLAYGREALAQLPNIRLIGTAEKKAPVFSFVIEGIHPHDIGTILDKEGIAIRAGHHCTQPIMTYFGVPATARASLTFYNTREEIDILVKGLGKVMEVFRA